MTSPTTNLYVYSLSGIRFEGPVESVTLPGEDGELTILPGHAGIVVALKKGGIEARGKDNKGSIATNGGFAYADQRQVIVLVEE